MRRRRLFLPAAATVLAALALAATPGLARAAMERVRFDATCDLARLRRALVEQVFRDGAETARAWDDETGCNHLTLSDPELRVDPTGEQVVVRMRGEGRKSWQVGGFCSFPFDWRGSFALGIEPVVDRDSGRLAFEVRSATAEDADGRARPVEGVLREWLRERVEPRFAGLRLAPGEVLPGLDRVLPEFVPGPIDDVEVARRTAESIRFDRVAVTADGLDLGVGFDVEAVSPAGRFRGMDDGAREVASVDSLRRLDGFATFVVESSADETSSRDAREALFGVLLEERHEMVAELAGLAAGAPADPTAPSREAFAATWPLLARAVRRAAAAAPPESRDRYAAFLASGDALRAIADLGPNSPLETTSDGLRALARLLAPDADRDPLAVDVQVDPRLRTLFGFGPPLARSAPEPEAPVDTPTPSVEPAWNPATATDPTPPPGASPGEAPPSPTATPTPSALARVARWVPTRSDADAYLAVAREGLARAVAEVAPTDTPGDVPLGAIVPAIAWQASCWQAWSIRGDRVVPRVARRGGVGWLGVDPRVWRGFFDPVLLAEDPGYNARAGVEIAARLASRELRSPGDAPPEDALPDADRALRAAAEIHALHEGGPAMLRRLREGHASVAEVEASRGFREKLARIRAGGLPGVEECFGAEPTPVPPAGLAPGETDSSPRADVPPGPGGRPVDATSPGAPPAGDSAQAGSPPAPPPDGSNVDAEAMPEGGG